MRPQSLLTLFFISTLVINARADIALDEFFNRASLLKSPAELAAIAKDNMEKLDAQRTRYSIAGCAVDVTFIVDKAQQLQLDITDACQPDINVLQQLDNPFDHKSPLTLKKFAEHAGDPVFYTLPKYPNTLFSLVIGSADSGNSISDPASANVLAISELSDSISKRAQLSCTAAAANISAKQWDTVGKLPVKRLILGWEIKPLSCK